MSLTNENCFNSLCQITLPINNASFFKFFKSSFLMNEVPQKKKKKKKKK